MERFPCGCPQQDHTVRTTARGEIRASWYAASCTQGTHAHAETRLVIPLLVGFATHYGSSTIDVRRDTILVRPAHEEHADRYVGYERCLTLLIGAEDLPVQGPVAMQHAGASSLGADIISEAAATDSASELVLECLLAELLDAVRQTNILRESSVPRWLRGVREHVEERALEGLTLDEAARESGRDAAYVANCFRRAFGMTIGECVRAVRLRRARELLASNSSSIAEVAHSCGYADQSHFTRHFRRTFSLTPAEYQRRRKALEVSTFAPR